MNNEILAKMSSLIEQRRYHDNLFFVMNTSEISDSEYDAIVAELKVLAEEYPEEYALVKDSKKPVDINITGSELKTAPLEKRMLSLDKALNKEEMEPFLLRVKHTDLVREYKYDGLAVKVRYENGTLISILTRGDGDTGEDVTHNAELIGDLPSIINREGVFEVVGEVYVSFKDFATINQLTDGYYKTPRSAASGILRVGTKNPAFTDPCLSFICYGLTEPAELADNYIKQRAILTGYSFKPPCDVSELKYLNDVRSDVFPVDGIVFKVNDFKEQQELGETDKFPKWAIAYKFPPETGNTELVDIEWYTGKTGAVTPVAVYNPLMLGGHQYTRATLYNYKQFIKLGLSPGCVIEVSRQGDVIPAVTRVWEQGDGEFDVPETCPSCNAILEFDGAGEDRIHIRCPNTSSCPGQFLKRVIDFCGKNGFDIEGLGDLTLMKLVEAGHVKDFVDIINLTESKLVTVGVSPKVAVKIMNSIDEYLDGTKKVSIKHFINSLSIPECGVGTSKRLSEVCSGKDGLLPLLTDYNALKGVRDVGPITAMRIVNFMKNECNFNVIKTLLGLVTLQETDNDKELIPICLTGGLDIPRNELTALFAEQGFEVIDTPTKRCKLLLVGQSFSELKYQRAEKLGLPIIVYTDNFVFDNAIKLIKEAVQ